MSFTTSVYICDVIMEEIIKVCREFGISKWYFCNDLINLFLEKYKYIGNSDKLLEFQDKHRDFMKFKWSIRISEKQQKIYAKQDI